MCNGWVKLIVNLENFMGMNILLTMVQFIIHTCPNFSITFDAIKIYVHTPLLIITYSKEQHVYDSTQRSLSETGGAA
jgi:hypothetical protein